jgi:hypothetical protein
MAVSSEPELLVRYVNASKGSPVVWLATKT